MKHAAVLVAAFVTISTPAIAADQFDLVCDGTVSAGSGRVPWSERYSVDLARGVYCDGGCSMLHLIARVEPGIIWFATKSPLGNAIVVGSPFDLFVNRMDEKIFGNVVGGLADGKCTSAPFRPLPKPLF